MALVGSGYLTLEAMVWAMADRATVSRVVAQPDMAGDILLEARIMEAATNPTSGIGPHREIKSVCLPLRFHNVDNGESAQFESTDVAAPGRTTPMTRSNF